jgi:hypothetical protein
MEMLSYTHMTMVHEDTIGPLNLQPLSFNCRLSIKRVSSTVAIVGMLMLGSFTALMTSAISRPAGVSGPSSVSGF